MMKIDPLDADLKDLDGISATFDETTSTITLTGLPYRELRSILTAASLHRHANPAPIPELGEDDVIAIQNAEVTQAWHWGQGDLIRYIDAMMVKAGTGTKSLAALDSIRADRVMRALFPKLPYTFETDIPQPEHSAEVAFPDHARIPNRGGILARLFKRG